MKLNNHWRIVLIGLFLLAIGALIGCHSPSIPSAPPRFGYQALKINGKFVTPEAFFEEKNSFFMRNRRNADMLRKTDEERKNLMLEEIINQVVMENYLNHQTGITVTPKEVDEYINRYIKAKFAAPSGFNSFMQDNDYNSEADLQKGIGLYLLKLKCFPKIARDMGLAVPPAELDSLFQKHVDENRATAHPKAEFADMILMQRFGESDRYKTWIAGLRSKATIEILDPALKAFRLYRDGRYDQAGALYEALFRTWKNELHLHRAIESFQMAKAWTKVVKLCQIGMKMYPEKVGYSLNKAEGLFRKGRVKEALSLLKNAETRSKGSPYFRSQVIETYSKLGLVNEAERIKNAGSKW
jgi:tetratricopeptide (TPR) repeat protein